MVLISDISPGPAYFLMMQNPWSDYEPICVERHYSIATRNAAKPQRRANSTHEHKVPKTKQTRSHSLQHAAVHAAVAAPEAELAETDTFASLQVHPIPNNNQMDDDEATICHPHTMLLRSMSDMPLTKSVSTHYDMPELIGGSSTDILSDPKVSKFLVPKIEACLPYRFRHKNWKLSFSLAQHGASLHTLFHRVRRQETTIVVIETADGDIFGGFATAPWTPCGLYYGTGESFVFTCHHKFELFPWTRKNTLLLFSDESTIAMGGGGGFAWALNHDLSQGTSAPSMTFDNRCLASRCNFAVVNFEVWQFASKYE
ncbi:hypothetical protein H310_08224 [Aphanomyces invadans]|uniref:Oxidation resistance protein 1 n=1 Tax=Aphanomyces invadans TaxID=157072 RepID=A0A024TZH0_9STRA|nr:hypothetical protein H310_08224 [Aphanomyces invadans]ETV99565.1 hypothetical protein H310_08224 [Aphanomyces invadans]|eukprot:XP_008872121.1 hypothetical protein H310_08224 [Aphanomyces invadans]